VEIIPDRENLFLHLLFAFPEWQTLMLHVGIFLLLICSALISGSEVAFFSLKNVDIKELKNSIFVVDKLILKLLANSRHLLATILISNNFINIGIIILSSFSLDKALENLHLATWLVFLINVVLVTFILVLFGEIAPKVYANINNLKLARFMAKPLIILSKIFSLPSNLLVKSTSIIEKKLAKNAESDAYSIEEIEQAIEITMQGEEDETSTIEQEAAVLKNILHFGENTINQIMCPRLDILAVEHTTTFYELLDLIRENNYSRIPVYKEQLDEIIGILYVKDLLLYLEEDNDFKWQSKIREPFYAVEEEKIEDLLRRFKEEKRHLAVVVDKKYGGVSGVVTMEDILEEIIGDFKDEFDDPLEINYLQLDATTFLFEGKTLLNDVCRITESDLDIFDAIKDKADSLGGLLIQLAEELPEVNQRFIFEHFLFEVIAVNDRSIQQVKMMIVK
jgi:gliding motility-associated protein GldE